jgi:hypothetical protein
MSSEQVVSNVRRLGSGQHNKIGGWAMQGNQAVDVTKRG